MLWICDDDLERVKDEIVAVISGVEAPPDCGRDLISDNNDPHQKELLGLVLDKQIHKCREYGCLVEGTCKYAFPYDRQPQQGTVLHSP